MIKFSNVDRQYQQDRDAYLDLADRIYSSGQVINGEYCRRLESSLKSLTKRQYCVLTASCTDALAFVGSTLIDDGTNTVVFPGISFPATDNGFLREYYNKPIEKIYTTTDSSGNIDLNHLEQILEYKTHTQKIIVVWVNLFGHTVNYDHITTIQKKYPTVTFVEDAAQSIGASWKDTPSGAMGVASCFSFDPTKNLNAFGLGGAVLTDCSNIAEWVDLHRRPHTNNWQNHGYNSQINELDAAIVWWKLENRFFDWQKRRTQIANYYMENINATCVVPNKNSVSAWHKFVIQHKNRDQIKAKLDLLGIETKIHYPRTLDNQENQFTRNCLSLPIYPELTDNEVEKIVKLTNRTLKLFS